ncbi:MAG: lysophospholipase [Chloroflexota bacterium]|nr:lysophospholipase [Chloroflexota bacterium]
MAAGASGWVVYKVTTTRRTGTPMAADTGCRTDPNTMADMSRFDPGAAPIRCEPWDIGTDVTGFVWRAPNPRAVLLLQHGYGEYAQRYVRHYNRLVPHLLHAGVSVYAFDLWGHGRSPGRRAVTDVGRAVEDHLAARRKLREQPLPVFLLGHSLGGLVTTASVARDGSGLRGVILSSAFLRRESKGGAFTRVLANVLAAVGPTLPAPVRPTPLSALSRIPEGLESVANDPLMHHGRLPILLAATSLNLIEDNQKRYRDWTAPTLVLHGTVDLSTDPEGSSMLYEAIASRDKTLHLVEGGRHELLNDTERDETLQVLLTWLEDRLPPRRA